MQQSRRRRQGAMHRHRPVPFACGAALLSASGATAAGRATRGRKRKARGCCCPEAAVRAVPARLLLLCLLLRSSWLTVEGDRPVGAAGVLHRRGNRAVSGRDQRPLPDSPSAPGANRRGSVAAGVRGGPVARPTRTALVAPCARRALLRATCSVLTAAAGCSIRPAMQT